VTYVEFLSRVKCDLCRVLQQSEVCIHLVFNLESIRSNIVRVVFLTAVAAKIQPSGV
jgi:hypothetical protein